MSDADAIVALQAQVADLQRRLQAFEGRGITGGMVPGTMVRAPFLVVGKNDNPLFRVLDYGGEDELQIINHEGKTALSLAADENWAGGIALRDGNNKLIVYINVSPSCLRVLLNAPDSAAGIYLFAEETGSGIRFVDASGAEGLWLGAGDGNGVIQFFDTATREEILRLPREESSPEAQMASG